jgi:pyruvate dehydrogenase E2 component (dihydrolipoamide acetyltransferase)
MLPLSLSYDHRLVDGAEAARFVRWVAEALEEPLLLALEG